MQVMQGPLPSSVISPWDVRGMSARFGGFRGMLHKGALGEDAGEFARTTPRSTPLFELGMHAPCKGEGTYSLHGEPKVGALGAEGIRLALDVDDHDILPKGERERGRRCCNERPATFTTPHGGCLGKPGALTLSPTLVTLRSPAGISLMLPTCERRRITCEAIPVDEQRAAQTAPRGRIVKSVCPGDSHSNPCGERGQTSGRQRREQRPRPSRRGQQRKGSWRSFFRGGIYKADKPTWKRLSALCLKI